MLGGFLDINGIPFCNGKVNTKGWKLKVLVVKKVRHAY